MRGSVPWFERVFFQFAAVAIVAACSPLLSRAQDTSQPQGSNSQQEIKYSQDPNASKNMTLLLKDFDPKPMLHVEAHEVPRAKFPVIDVHNHVNDAGGIHGEEVPPADVVKAMDAANVRRIVILTGMWGEALQRVLD